MHFCQITQFDKILDFVLNLRVKNQKVLNVCEALIIAFVCVLWSIDSKVTCIYVNVGPDCTLQRIYLWERFEQLVGKHKIFGSIKY